MAKRTNRIALALMAGFAAVLIGIAQMGLQLRPCWAEVHRGSEADSSRPSVSDGSLYQGDLRYRNLRGANLRGIALPGWTDLTGADLTNANLEGASLDSAILNSAHLCRVNLRGANLHAADLMNTDLRGAELCGANLRAADFWNADLRDARIAGAQYDLQTRWPGDFDPTNRGAIWVEATPETPPSLVAVDVLFLGALIFVIAGFVVWLTPLLQLLRWIDSDETRMRIFWCCTLFGLAYGAAFGSLCGPGLWLPTGSGAFSAIIGGVIDGALLGAFGGGVAGFIGNLIGWRIGWTLPGVFGSATAAACMWSVTCIAAGWEPNQLFRQRNLVNGALWCSGVILIGGLLGAALDRAMRRGHSFVPGFQWLAAIIGGRARPAQESSRAGTEGYR